MMGIQRFSMACAIWKTKYIWKLGQENFGIIRVWNNYGIFRGSVCDNFSNVGEHGDTEVTEKAFGFAVHQREILGCLVELRKSIVNAFRKILGLTDYRQSQEEDANKQKTFVSKIKWKWRQTKIAGIFFSFTFHFGDDLPIYWLLLITDFVIICLVDLEIKSRGLDKNRAVHKMFSLFQLISARWLCNLQNLNFRFRFVYLFSQSLVFRMFPRSIK